MTMLTTVQVAGLLNLSPNTIRRYTERGLIARSEKVGSVNLYSRDEVERYKRERRRPGRPKQR